MNSEKHSSDFYHLNSALEKMLELGQTKKKESLSKIILTGACSLGGIIILVTLCLIFYREKFSMESLISLLLAFFSIFISIFFYFKASETSNQFYETSYNFMKDVSVTLGKIQERFGEKLNSLNDKMSHLSAVKEEKTEELQTAEDERQKLINELMDKAKLNEEQRDDYQRKLRERERDVDMLQRQLRRIERQYQYARQEVQASDDNQFMRFLNMLSNVEKKMFLGKSPLNWSDNLKEKALRLGLINLDGELTPKGKNFFIQYNEDLSV